MNNFNILVVDDNHYIINVFKQLMLHFEIEIFIANNGFDALMGFEMHSPSIIILDVNLPDISGCEVHKIIRRKSTVPIIFITGLDMSFESEGLIETSSDYILMKPFDIADLMVILRSYLPD